VPDALAERHKIIHTATIPKDWMIFRQFSLQRTSAGRA